MELLANFLSFTYTDRNLITVVDIRKANLLLNRHTATNNTLLLLRSSSSSSTKDSLLPSLNMANTSKDLLSQTSTRVPAAVLPLLPQPLNSSVMAPPIATTSDTRTAPAGEKPF
jgi:hypothetical protein